MLLRTSEHVFLFLVAAMVSAFAGWLIGLVVLRHPLAHELRRLCLTVFRVVAPK
jgi:ABC-type proline/glycine betaine transport system permease subunit